MLSHFEAEVMGLAVVGVRIQCGLATGSCLMSSGATHQTICLIDREFIYMPIPC
ncbi:uncharacterized protein METZ01_LOCUS347303 [marine metagenome]|uniref:Uncharacterized protein n=1 Tax=marine metagenome TaxID=408172 RepID=A0A382R9S8_9ZZZZ